MPDVHANVEAISGLREMLLRFGYSQTEAVEQVRHTCDGVLDNLQTTRQRWEYEVRHRNEAAQACTEEAIYAAHQGYYIDCSPEYAALQDAEDSLNRSLRALYRFEHALDQLRPIHNRTARSLDSDVPRAVSYLEALLSGMEAYLAVQILGSSTTNSTPSTGASASESKDIQQPSMLERESGPESRERGGGLESRG